METSIEKKILKTKLFNDKIIVLDTEMNITIKSLEDEIITQFEIKTPQISIFKPIDLNLIDISSKYIVVIHFSKIHIYSIENFKRIKILQYHFKNQDFPTKIKLYKNDLMIGTQEGETKIYSMQNCAIIHQFESLKNKISNIQEELSNIFIMSNNGYMGVYNSENYNLLNKVKNNKEILNIKKIGNHFVCVTNSTIEILNLNFEFNKILLEYNANIRKISSIEEYNNHLFIKFDNDNTILIYNKNFELVNEFLHDEKIEKIITSFENDKDLIFVLANNNIEIKNTKKYIDRLNELLEQEQLSKKDLIELLSLKNNFLLKINEFNVNQKIEQIFKKDFAKSIKLMAIGHITLASKRLEKWIIFDEFKDFIRLFQKDIQKYQFVKTFYKEKKYTLLNNIVKQYKTLKFSPEYLKFEDDFKKLYSFLENNKQKLSSSKIIELSESYLGIVEKNKLILKLIASK